MQLMTMSREDARFSSYLWGTFSKAERALPMDSLHPSTVRERVTFRIVPLAEVARPPWWRVYLAALRPQLLPLTLGPSVVAWLAHGPALETWRPVVSWLSLLGVFFLHVAVCIWNDVFDHIQGSDRLSSSRGSRVIQKGWTTAHEMSRWGWVNAGLALACGVPALWLWPMPLLVICVLAMGAVWIWTRATRWSSRWARAGAMDVSVFLLFGPLLTLATATASFGEWSAVHVWLGVFFGLVTLWVLQVRQLADLFRARPKGFRTFLASLSFDRAKSVVVWSGYLVVFCWPLLAALLRVPLVSMLFLPLASWPLLAAIEKVRRARSPLSSDLLRMPGKVMAAYWWITGWWIMVLSAPWALLP
jgi:1,4-dihydroxy-2-naphthoate polyprenyltransferase